MKDIERLCKFRQFLGEKQLPNQTSIQQNKRHKSQKNQT
jgi:hypothetical protein